MPATSTPVDSRYARALGVVLVVHLVANVVHGAAHAEIPVPLHPALAGAVLLTHFVLPIAGVALLWRGAVRLGLAGFTVGMALSFGLATPLHFVLSTPDHVAAVPPGPWRQPFQLTAVALSVTDAFGAALGGWLWRTLPERRREDRPRSGRVEGVSATGFRPLPRLTYWGARRWLGAVPDSLTVLAHHRRVLAGTTAFEVALDGADEVDDRLTELAVLRAATVIGCELCIDIGAAEARKLGIAEEQLRVLRNYEESPAFSERERLVLRYADALTATPAVVPDELFDALAAAFDEAELVELTAAIAFENYRGRFNRAFGLAAQGFSAGAYCPAPDLPAQNRSHPPPTRRE